MLDWDSDSGTRIFIPYTLYCFKPTPLCVSLRVASSFFRADSNHPSMPVFLLSRSVDEMKRLEEMSGMFRSSGAERHPPEPKSQTEGVEDSGGKEQPWEMVMDKKHFKLWRRPISGTHLYQYRGESRLAAGAVFCPSRCSALCSLTLSILVLSREHCHGVLLFFLSLMTGIMASGPITSWQIDGETVDTVADYFSGLQNHCRW